jgi:hypothetical protein
MFNYSFIQFEHLKILATLTTTMTKTEHERLSRLIRQHVTLTKAGAKERVATLKADFEQQLDTRYSYDTDEVWNEAVKVADKAVDEANEKIAERCRKLGIPKQFAPSMTSRWWDRGRNSVKEERAEMRRVAYTRLDALAQSAVLAVEKEALRLQTELTAGSLDSADAKAFLGRLPAIEKLMPALNLKELTGGEKSGRA